MKGDNKAIHSKASGLGKYLKKPSVITTMLAVPFVIHILVFSYVPLLGWAIAFFKYTPGVPIFKQEFVGFYHFVRIFTTSPNFIVALRNTLVLSFLGLLATPLPIILAILINEMRSKKYSRFVQTVTSLPNFVSWILVYAVAFAFFSVDGGVINTIFHKKLGLLPAPSNVLANSTWAWITQALLSIWKNIGWSAIIYIAAISGIDQSLYEAAKVDGAGRFKRIIHITVPGLSETYVVLLILNIANILSIGFEQYWVFQNPMTMGQLEVLDTYIYRTAMSGLAFDSSTAIGILKTIVSVTLLFTVNTLAKKIRGKSII